MDFPRDARMDVFWPVADIPVGMTGIDVQLGAGNGWLPMSITVLTTTTAIVSAYLAGPDYPSPGTAYVIPDTPGAPVVCRIRCVTARSTVPVAASSITLTSD